MPHRGGKKPTVFNREVRNFATQHISKGHIHWMQVYERAQTRPSHTVFIRPCSAESRCVMFRFYYIDDMVCGISIRGGQGQPHLTGRFTSPESRCAMASHVIYRYRTALADGPCERLDGVQVRGFDVQFADLSDPYPVKLLPMKRTSGRTVPRNTSTEPVIVALTS